MNWTTFNTHNQSANQAFEELCNQLFENWCKSEYKDKVDAFIVTNGDGGDGGVESYVTLKNGDIIGVQAKWFPQNISAGQISQIRNSINTALKLRPNIVKYIVCIPRNLSDLTGRGKNTERKRWTNLVEEINLNYKNLDLELWDEAKITKELEKNEAVGINRYWFEKSEFSEEAIKLSFNKSKESWLNPKYVPELNSYGYINHSLSLFLGEYTLIKELFEEFQNATMLCDSFIKIASDLLSEIEIKDSDMLSSINENIAYTKALHKECSNILKSLYNDSYPSSTINMSFTPYKFNELIDYVNQSTYFEDFYFHKRDMIKPLKKLAQINFNDLFMEYNSIINVSPILFIGKPGTGKTQGVAAYCENILNKGFHTPIIIEAKSINDNASWKDIILNAIGLSSNWSENELFQALISMSNRKRFNKENINNEIIISPKIIIIVDAIDECVPSSKWYNLMKQSVAITKMYPKIRFCFTSRPNAELDKLNNINKLEINDYGDAPTYKLFDSYIEKYNIKIENYGYLKYAFSTPLSLKLFCQINENKTIKQSQQIDTSLSNLIKNKIKLIDNEFNKKERQDSSNQYVLKTITEIAIEFAKTPKIEREYLISLVSNKLKISEKKAEKIIAFLNGYGVLYSYKELGKGLNPDKYFYFHGIQGYFDYSIARYLLDKYKHPEKINFNEYSEIGNNSIYILAIISIQEYNYLITNNKTFSNIQTNITSSDLVLYALRYTSYEDAKVYEEKIYNLMSKDANNLLYITNNLILPLSRDENHPLGVKLLDRFLFSFSKPANRDLFWSAPLLTEHPENIKWYKYSLLDLENKEFMLSIYDVCNGCPTIYAWSLSSLNNNIRKNCRKALMQWAKLVPNEFYNLFIKFSNVNDPQIRSDIFSILMCLVYEDVDDSLINKSAKWMIENILSPDKIFNNNDISIRYYAIAIVKRAVSVGVISNKDAEKFMPPYCATTYNLPLSKEAVSGTIMTGYKPITYDIARYVLIDYFNSNYSNAHSGENQQIQGLIKKVCDNNLFFDNITFEQFILSSAYKYILQMGWNENDFYNFNSKDNHELGLDIAISSEYYHSSHGAKSQIMTTCEKYIWQFRNYMNGFLSDRLSVMNNGNEIKIEHYELLDNFANPSQEIDYDGNFQNCIWHIPERDKVLGKTNFGSQKTMENAILKPKKLDLEKWIFVNNTTQKYKLDSNPAIALYSFSDFFSPSGIETTIFINSIIIKKDCADKFIKQILSSDKSLSDNINPTSWSGSFNPQYYISPNDICKFPWLIRYDSSLCDSFENLDVHSAVDECYVYNSKKEELNYKLPSSFIRDLLNIKKTNGHHYFNNKNKVCAEYTVAGEQWETYQGNLFVDKNLLTELHKINKDLIWIICVDYQNDKKSEEKFGSFFVENIVYYIGYINNNKFIINKIRENKRK